MESTLDAKHLKRQQELEVIIAELRSLKKGAEVYRKQQNSNVYFVVERDRALSDALLELDKLKLAARANDQAAKQSSTDTSST